ncbi:MAG: transposase [Betaproteobacteria bacterium]
MARPLRIEFPGALYHLTSRGDKQEDVFLDDADREEFLSVLGSVVERFGWRVYAYCLMDNHYHLMVETPQANLSRGMRQLNGVYTQRVNRRHGRVGHVFQGRFKAILVDEQNYLLELSRYVVLNPVRTKAVKDPGRYRWSSYRATVGEVSPPSFLDTASLLDQFAAITPAAQRRYRDFVLEGLRAPSPWTEVKGQVLLGKEGFLRKVNPKLKSIKLAKEIPRAQRQVGRPSLAKALKNLRPGDKPTRRRLIATLHLRHGYTQAEIGQATGLHYSTVSRIVARQISARNKT